MTRDAIRDAAIALSFSNLFFVRVWADLFIRTEDLFYLAEPPVPLVFWLPVAFVLVVAGPFWVLLRRSRRLGNGELERSGRILLLAALVLALNGVRSLMPQLSIPMELFLGKSRSPGPLLMALIPLAVVALLAVSRVSWVIRVVSGFALASSFAIPVTIGRAIWEGVRVYRGERDAAMHDRAPTARHTGVPERRVLVLLFDELDESVAFSGRSGDLVLPQLDRLKAESIACQNAYPPSLETITSVPAMLTGLDLQRSVPAGPDNLLLQVRGSPTAVPWSRTPDLFSLVQAAGYDAAIVGWYLPYCRIVGDRVVECHSFAMYRPPTTAGPILRGALTRVIEIAPGALRTEFAGRIGLKPAKSTYAISAEWHLKQRQAVLDSTTRLAVDPSLALVFAHFPIPHPPYIFDRATQSLTTTGKAYQDNLALVDLTLGEIRSRLEAAGQWERTAVIVISDHSLRFLAGSAALLGVRPGPEVGNRAHRVPLMIKPPGAAGPGSTFGPVVRTTVLKDLVVELLSGGGSHDADHITKWLTGHLDNSK